MLIDVEDVALGHTTKLRWNESGKWIRSDKAVRSRIIDRETFGQVQTMISGRATAPAGHKPHRRKHPYALRGLVTCGICGRRMQSHTVHGDAYYRCRFPAEYALANRVEHPLSVNLREDAIIGHLDRGLAREFAPHRRLVRTPHDGHPQFPRFRRTARPRPSMTRARFRSRQPSCSPSNSQGTEFPRCARSALSYT